jgi:hypothetical protein
MLFAPSKAFRAVTMTTQFYLRTAVMLQVILKICCNTNLYTLLWYYIATSDCGFVSKEYFHRYLCLYTYNGIVTHVQCLIEVLQVILESTTLIKDICMFVLNYLCTYYVRSGYDCHFDPRQHGVMGHNQLYTLKDKSVNYDLKY